MVDSPALGALLGRAPSAPGHPFALVVLCPTMPSPHPSDPGPVLSAEPRHPLQSLPRCRGEQTRSPKAGHCLTCIHQPLTLGSSRGAALRTPLLLSTSPCLAGQPMCDLYTLEGPKARCARGLGPGGALPGLDCMLMLARDT